MTHLEATTEGVIPAADSKTNVGLSDNPERFSKLSRFQSSKFVSSKDDGDLSEEARKCMGVLEEEYGMGIPPKKGDAVLVMGGWNKCLAFKSSFSEALFNRWRLALKDARAKKPQGTKPHRFPWSKKDRPTKKAVEALEYTEDPLAKILATRLSHARDLLMEVLDGMVRSLCPHAQGVMREAYRPRVEDLMQGDESSPFSLHKLGLIHGTKWEYTRIFARCGVKPQHWVLFCEAFLWAMKTHSPYANEDDAEDLTEKSKTESAYANFVATHFAKRAIVAVVHLRQELSQSLYTTCVKDSGASLVQTKSTRQTWVIRSTVSCCQTTPVS